MRIVFMGTPEFAVPALQALLDSHHEVAAVFTQPDRPAGRGQKLTQPPIKHLAMVWGVPVFQPESMKSEEALQQLAAAAPDLLVVAAYGQILPQRVLDVPRVAPLNIHASLLPRYRGAAPINWAIIRGEIQTGISIMRMVRQLDAGPVLLQRPELIRAEDTAGTLHDRLKRLGAACLLDGIRQLECDRAQFTDQDEGRVTWAPSLNREMARLSWPEPARACHNLVRGLNPWPVANTMFRGEVCKVLATRCVQMAKIPETAPGTLRCTEGRLFVACANGQWLEVVTVQFPGRQPVSGGDFANGTRLGSGERFE